MTPTVGKGLYIVKRNGKFVKVIKKKYISNIQY